jgi:hypothetical protein
MQTSAGPAVHKLGLRFALADVSGKPLRVQAIRGTGDNVMSRTDSEAIVQIVNQVHPGRAIYRLTA